MGRSARSYASHIRESTHPGRSLTLWPIPSWNLKPHFWLFFAIFGVFSIFGDWAKSEKSHFLLKIGHFRKICRFWLLADFLSFCVFSEVRTTSEKLKKLAFLRYDLQKINLLQMQERKKFFHTKFIFIKIIFLQKIIFLKNKISFCENNFIASFLCAKLSDVCLSHKKSAKK